MGKCTKSNIKAGAKGKGFEVGDPAAPHQNGHTSPR